MSAYAKLTRAMAIEARHILEEAEGAEAAVYVPSHDVAADIAFYRDVLGARVVAVREEMGTLVAELVISPSGPRVALAQHLEPQGPVLLRRTSDLQMTLAELRTRGFEPSDRVELPLGPSVTLRSPGGQRLGLYQPARAQADQRATARTDLG
jgi:catechol 2,3-dioxygenase-like lactoylglutathione lyase family enzyme